MASKETERVRRWQKANPEKFRASWKRRWQNRKHKAAAQRADRRARFKSMQPGKNHERIAVLTLDQLLNPRFLYIDAHGTVSTEYLESPEQLAEQLRKEGRL